MTNKTKIESSDLTAVLKILDIHTDYFVALWKYYRQDCGGIASRNQIESAALRLAQRIYSSMSVQFKSEGFDSFHQVTKTCRFTCIKAYAEALTADYLSFMHHLSFLTSLHYNTSGLSVPESLFYDNFKASCFNEKSPYSQAAGEISFELKSPSNSETLEEACVTTAFHITYALWCAPDVHRIIGSLDVLEHYYANSRHPLVTVKN